MSNFSRKLVSKLKYGLIYLVGFLIILMILALGGFFIAKPYLDKVVAQEIARRNIKADASQISLLGKVNLENVIIPAPAGLSVKAQRISARPPIGFLSGTATLYDVEICRDNIRIHIPQLQINGIQQKPRNPALQSKLLETLNRFSISAIDAPQIQLTIKTPSGKNEGIDLNGFWARHLQNGRIGEIGIESFNSTLNVNTLAGLSTHDVGALQRSKTPQREMQTAATTQKLTGELLTKGRALSIANINIDYAYQIFTGSVSNIIEEQGQMVVGSMNFNDISFDVFNKNERVIHFALGAFTSQGLKMRPMQKEANQWWKSYLEAKNTNDEVAKKEARNRLIGALLSAITTFNAEIKNANFDLPELKLSLDHFNITPRRWRHPIPESMLISLDNLVINTAKMPQNDLKILKNLGFDAITLSGKLDFNYDEIERTLTLNTLSFDAKNIGAGALSGQAIHVEPNLFSNNQSAILASAEKIGIAHVSLSYIDYGFIDRLFTYLDQQLSDGKGDLKKELYEDLNIAMAQTPRLLLKGHKETEALAQALSSFAKNPGKLSIDIQTKAGQMLSINDLNEILQNNLSHVLDKVDLRAKNE